MVKEKHGKENKSRDRWTEKRGWVREQSVLVTRERRVCMDFVEKERKTDELACCVEFVRVEKVVNVS